METQQTDIIKNIAPLIDGFCKIILTDNDCFNYEQAEEYIDKLTDSNKSDLNSVKEDLKKAIQDMALIQIINYLQGFHSATIGSPFQFDSGDSFFQYRKHFEEYYAVKNNNIDIPYVFRGIFDYIKSTSDHYRIFEQFYNVRVVETSDTILAKTQSQAEEAVKAGVEKATKEATKRVEDAVNNAINEASNKAQAFAEVASESAKTAMEKAKGAAEKAAEEATKNAIELEMNKVTKHISETSVTILGIFSGIVLTVVAGLFYSSSVLENINSANFFRLLTVAALVGLVCFGLIVIMFKFIEQISGKPNNTGGSGNNNFFSDITVRIVTGILIVVMLVGFIFQFIFPNETESTSENITNQVTVQTTVPKSDSQDDNTDKTSTAPSTTQ